MVGGLAVLWPSGVGGTVLLFANAFGAVATAYALTGSSLNIVPIVLYAQIRGDVLHNENLGYALALGMVLVTGLSNGGDFWVSLRARKGASVAPTAQSHRATNDALQPRAGRGAP